MYSAVQKYSPPSMNPRVHGSPKYFRLHPSLRQLNPLYILTTRFSKTRSFIHTNSFWTNSK